MSAPDLACLRLALELANAERWSRPIPIVPVRLRLALDSLLRRRPRLWEASPEELAELLTAPGWAGQVCRDHDAVTLGFALRDARM